MIKIFGISKFELHNYYNLEKKQEFFAGFRKLLTELGFGREDSNPIINRFGRPTDSMGEAIQTKEDDIKEYVDRHEFFDNKDYMIDIVFGKERIFLIIATKRDRQQEISQKVQKFCSY